MQTKRPPVYYVLDVTCHVVMISRAIVTPNKERKPKEHRAMQPLIDGVVSGSLRVQMSHVIGSTFLEMTRLRV